MAEDVDALFEGIRARLEELGPQSHRRESFVAHLRSLSRWERDRADYPNPGTVSFPEALHVAFAVCHPECGSQEFVVDGGTQECQRCGGLMFRTDVAKYRLVTTPGSWRACIRTASSRHDLATSPRSPPSSSRHRACSSDMRPSPS